MPYDDEALFNAAGQLRPDALRRIAEQAAGVPYYPPGVSMFHSMQGFLFAAPQGGGGGGGGTGGVRYPLGGNGTTPGTGASYTITPNDSGLVLVFNGPNPSTANLPPATAGATILTPIYNQGPGLLTIQPAAGVVLLVGGAPVTSFPLAAGAAVWLWSDGSLWLLMGCCPPPAVSKPTPGPQLQGTTWTPLPADLGKFIQVPNDGSVTRIQVPPNLVTGTILRIGNPPDGIPVEVDPPAGVLIDTLLGTMLRPGDVLEMIFDGLVLRRRPRPPINPQKPAWPIQNGGFQKPIPNPPGPNVLQNPVPDFLTTDPPAGGFPGTELDLPDPQGQNPAGVPMGPGPVGYLTNRGQGYLELKAPAGVTIDGQPSISLPPNQDTMLVTDGVNYQTFNGGYNCGLQGKAVSTTPPTDGQVLTYVGADSQWEPKAAPGAGAATNKATEYTGTTTSGFATIFDVTNPSGLHGSVGVKNTGANALTYKMTYTDLYGTVTSGTTTVGPGAAVSSTSFDTTTGAVPPPVVPIKEAKLEVQDQSAGSHTTYDIWLSLLG